MFFTFSLPTKAISPPPPQSYISRKNPGPTLVIAYLYIYMHIKFSLQRLLLLKQHLLLCEATPQGTYIRV